MTVYTFTAAGTTEWVVPEGVTSVNVLVVGGGGGGGVQKFFGRGGGGGGGGGLVLQSATLTPGSGVSVTVGAAGAGGTYSTQANGLQGGNSAFGEIEAVGGGGGAGFDSVYIAATSGGSGGGEAGADAERLGAAGTVGQGSRGGNVNSHTDPGGGGGGYSSAGGDTTSNTVGPNGGAGVTLAGLGLPEVEGIPGAFAGGGGGGHYNNWQANRGLGGLGGGGDAGDGTGQDGAVNTGGGGGGGQGASSSVVGGSGGSGIVVVFVSEGGAGLSFSPGALASQHSYLDIDDGVLSPLRIPISSWQATLQADRSSFVQAVIPAALDWVDELTARQDDGEIIITHAVRQIDGSEQAWEVVRAPLQQINFDRGPQRVTARVSSYTTLTAGPSETSVALRNVRSVSISPGVRVRCDLDPTVRPGNTVTFGSTSFVAAYINHYATDSDRYMDVGERPL